MDQGIERTLQEVRDSLGEYPDAISTDLDRALTVMQSALSEAQVAEWAASGLAMANQTVRSWEAAAHYYRVSPIVLGYMPFNYFLKWANCGSALCGESPTLASAYFEASPGAMSKLRSRHIESWAGLGRSLYRGTWKSSTLACKFFASSPDLLDTLTFPELERFVGFLGLLSHRSHDLSAECLALSQRLFPLLEGDKAAFVALISAMAETGWREVKGFLESATKALPRIQADERIRFLTIAERLVDAGVNIPTAMLDISQSMTRIDSEYHSMVFELSERLLDTSPLAVPELFKVSPQVLDKTTPRQFERWFSHGLEVLGQNPDAGQAYFKLESTHSEEVLEALSSGVEFGRIRDVMEMYCRALAGEEIKLAESQELVDKNIGWVSSESASTEGSAVYLPAVVDRYTTKDDNFAWFKVVSTHQVAHLEFGSFHFDFDTPSSIFKDLRPELEAGTAAARAVSTSPVEGEDGVGVERAWVTDMQRFFNSFEDRKLALDVFTVIEDGRLDTRVKSEYAGIRRSYERVQGDSLADRREIESLPMREAMVEFIVRISLQQREGLKAPSQHVDEARDVARIVRRVLVPEATVEDVAEAALRVYAIISQIPNEEVPPDEWEDVDVDDDEEYMDPEGMERLLQQMAQGLEVQLRPEGEEEYEQNQEVDYRGDFKPELVQLLTQLRMQQDQSGQGGGEPLTPEQLEELLKNSAELDIEAVPGEARDSSGLFDNILKETGTEMPQSEEFGQGPFVHVDEDGGALAPTEPQTFVYDEWDFRADDYKPRWCIVRQKTMAEGDPNFFASTLHDYASLVVQIRRQFELMVPEMFRKVRKLEDGEDIDIDDVIEALVDIRTGVSPSDKFYWRRNKVQRDVAAAFLLDTSASTAEAIDEAKRSRDDWDAPDDPVEYMVWLRNRRGEAMRRSYKRIIDVEKEAIVLIANALEAIGDIYGVYGFSGYGRENVEFYTIKDLDENFTERVKRRIDRIAPLHATRMGPAIRHVTSKLERQEARTKLLFLISDGRPQDRGYSREGVEKEYAVHDTKMALDEARRKDIEAFCLTVDKNGHDYLKTMCQDIGYEVLDDTQVLPQRLLFLYKRLTM